MSSYQTTEVPFGMSEIPQKKAQLHSFLLGMVLVVFVAVTSFKTGAYSASPAPAVSLRNYDRCLGSMDFFEMYCGVDVAGCIWDARFGHGTFDDCVPADAEGMCKRILDGRRKLCI